MCFIIVFIYIFAFEWGLDRDKKGYEYKLASFN